MAARFRRSLLHWAFHHFYHGFAWTYDTVAALVSRGYWQRWIEAAVPLLHGEQVLELGCGTGYLQRALAQRGVRAVGLDGSAYMLRHTRRKLARTGSQAPLLRGRSQALPFAAESFTDVVATFPAEYILDPATHAEAWRVLQPGGQMIMIDAAYFVQRTAYTAAVDAAYRATGQVRHTDLRPALLHAAGFQISERWIAVDDSRVQALIGVKIEH
jgi:ubiquinone/menaquinone biosynthesis C-methylase UbiE